MVIYKSIKKEILLRDVKFYYAQCVFNTTIYYKVCDRIEKRNKCFDIISYSSLLLSFIVMFSKTVFNEWNFINQYGEYVSIILVFASLFSGMLNVTNIFFGNKPNHDYRNTAEEYKALRDHFRILISDIKKHTFYHESLNQRYRTYIDCYSLIGRLSKPTTEKDYVATQKALGLNGVNESFTWSEEEIDRFL